MAQRFDPPDVWQPFGAFAMGVCQGEGQVVYLKGQVALDAAGQSVGHGDMERPVRQVLENIQRVLAHIGGTMADVIALTQFTTDIEAFMKAGAIRAEFFKPPYPVTTTVEVRRLYDPALLIEITAVAEIPRDRFRPPAKPA